MEKMLETEEKIPVETVVAELPKWEVDLATGLKRCEKCGFELHGWAFRQTFRFCPNCGEEKAI